MHSTITVRESRPPRTAHGHLPAKKLQIRDFGTVRKVAEKAILHHWMVSFATVSAITVAPVRKQRTRVIIESAPIEPAGFLNIIDLPQLMPMAPRKSKRYVQVPNG